MFRDSLQRYSSTVFIVFDREIPERHNAHNAFVPIEHRKTTDLIFLHDPLSFFDILILEAVDDLPSHDFFDRGALWISAIRDSSNRKIAIGKYTYEAVSVTDGENTYIKGAHLLGGFLDRRLQCDDFHIFCHDTIKLHGRYGWALRGSIQGSHPGLLFRFEYESKPPDHCLRDLPYRAFVQHDDAARLVLLIQCSARCF